MALANSMPSIPFEISIIRDNVYNISMPRSASNRPAIVSQHLPNSCYLQDANGTYIDYDGIPVRYRQTVLFQASLWYPSLLC
jgi:hypothetical protein